MRYLLLLLLMPGLVLSQVGPNSAGVGANNNSVGTINWSNPGNITGSDDARATQGTLGTSRYVQGTTFGFALPATDVVSGIQLQVEKSTEASDVEMRSASWTTGTASGMAVTRPTGANRILIVIIGIENATAPRNINSVTYGGEPLAVAGEADQATPFYARTEVWYLLEADIATAANTTLSYTFAGGSDPDENFEIISAAFYRNVDQTSPFIEVELGGTTSGASNYQLPNTLTTNEGSMSIMGIFCGAPPSTGGAGNVNGFTINQGYTERVDYHGMNGGFTTSGGVLFVAELATTGLIAPAAGTTQPTFTFNGSANRRTVVAISLRRMRNVDSNVRLKKLSGYVGSNLALTTTDWSKTDAYVTYGGPGNLWGTTWSILDVDNAGFGAGLSVTSQNGTVRVDHMRISIYRTSVLPLTLVSFDAEQEGTGITCNWVTASERNTDQFFIERSSDGIHFEVIGVLDAAGDSETALMYRFRDEQPEDGINYYRLKTVDNDGSSTKSDIVAAEFTRAGNITLFPNPANEWATVLTPEGFDEIVITDARGQIVDRFEGTTLQTEQKLNITDMPDGTYFVCIKSQNGRVEIQKLIKTSRTL
jgi:hypothetical protein